MVQNVRTSVRTWLAESLFWTPSAVPAASCYGRIAPTIHRRRYLTHFNHAIQPKDLWPCASKSYLHVLCTCLTVSDSVAGRTWSTERWRAPAMRLLKRIVAAKTYVIKSFRMESLCNNELNCCTIRGLSKTNVGIYENALLICTVLVIRNTPREPQRFYTFWLQPNCSDIWSLEVTLTYISKYPSLRYSSYAMALW